MYCVWGCASPDEDFAVSLLNLMRLLPDHFSSLWPSGLSASPPNFVSSTNLLRVHSVSSSKSIMMMLNRTGLQESHDVQQNKFKVLCLGWDNPMQKYRLGDNCLGNRSTEMDLVGMVYSKLNKSQQCTLTAKMTNHVLGSISRSTASRSREVSNPSLLSPLVRPHLKYTFRLGLSVTRQGRAYFSESSREPPRWLGAEA